MGKRWTLAAAIAAIVLACAPARAASLVPPSLDGGGSAVVDFRLFPFWQKVLDDMGSQPTSAESASLQPVSLSGALPACTDQRHCTPPEWTDFLATLRGQDSRAQMDAVHHWANAKPYVEDIVNWFIPDYWETPGEFLARGGDCEDFAIIKYYSLIRLGFAPQNMRIVVVLDTQKNSFHAVLSVVLDDATWILDNFLPQIVKLEDLPQYRPIYSLNQQDWAMHSNPSLQLTGMVIAADTFPPDRR